MGKNRKQTQQKASPAVRYVVIGLGLTLLFLALATTRQANAAHHPEPRGDLSLVTVESASRYADYPRIAEIYQMAAQIPHVLDGLYCHCDCSKHSDHRSLLTCFEDDHGAACDVCLTEAALAHRMTNEGRSLKEIREAVDDLYRR
jgi:hypothetical protein